MKQDNTPLTCNLSACQEVIKGYLVTLPDGHECRLGPDKTRAENYAAANRAISIEPMYVRRVEPQKEGNQSDF